MYSLIPQDFLYFLVLNEICLHENAFLIKFLVYIVQYIGQLFLNSNMNFHATFLKRYKT